MRNVGSIPDGCKRYFPSQNAQTGPDIHPAFCSVFTGPFLREQSGQCAQFLMGVVSMLGISGFIHPLLCVPLCRGTWWRSWLRHCATSRKFAALIPDGVTEIFH